ncbi:flagellar biosynthesis protein FliS [Herbaspirillum rubrisubalbicans]|jgi:flagellar protein FliS|uniref:Flagellar secretion chaperone FliS n=2 Tax=Herbaspirillum rubrisubalbicans TaxID=80842 RepID=A0AAD0U6G7_9BURK|nr:flagellar export chaperone FliS [Herbaspirillum rubrisubalbicans]ALU89142.1 flagellin-specific chaperone FliS protein [Herbaspirillum rubrisubalbicans M1]AYR24163.1 flagellar export chaperone FliS [Herbaspirillum rubrisubalbicans]MCP1572111.1 flagellar protein FliS [Herbaspirillum rubrisubalbicans]NQE48577.1 flagellar biosynthesis protein FliS [Herbaspirillum rubrisubalbicans]QJQ00754.1 flagellar export chaperone FliS [Herbaspirillum rubrisubalbicans Os34]
MFGSMKRGANAYANIGVETGVIAASPHKLITMLFDGALVAIALGKKSMGEGNIKDKGESITKAILIIDNGLRASLNKEVGGELALNLDSLYEYMSRRLFEANATNNPAILDEIHGLLEDIRSAWEQIGPNAAQASPQMSMMQDLSQPSYAKA